MRKNIFLSIIFLLSFFNVNAQYSIRGKVVSEDGVAVPNATVLIIKANLSKTTDSIGQFEFNGIPFPRRFNLLVSSVGFETTKFDATTDDHVLIILPKQTYSIDEVVVTSTRNPIKTNFTSQTIDSKKLNAQNTGVNLPYLLSSTPSLVATSDDGLGVGYTYFRVRGVDQTRINMTVNGVPLNDSESQDVFWVNMTDFASGLANVQVQRGVGTSTNGPAAFGASVNMLTALTADHPYAKIEFNAGSYNTFRESAKISTGLMPNGFAFDARISKVNSDGYLERAASDLYSYNFQGAYFNAGTMFKLLVFGGKEKTYMAWDGVDAETLAENPRYNPAGKYKDDNGKTAFYDNQTDNYEQQHFQLHFT
ncbi:MAG: TonB-dependent receptor, partial [Paludibacter sp.]|nr:TonB-dependent receptor [Paludibacter sp.]